MSTQHDLEVRIVPVTTVSRPLKKLDRSFSMKVCRPCGVGFVVKQEKQDCPFCKASFDEAGR